MQTTARLQNMVIKIGWGTNDWQFSQEAGIAETSIKPQFSDIERRFMLWSFTPGVVAFTHINKQTCKCSCTHIMRTRRNAIEEGNMGTQKMRQSMHHAHRLMFHWMPMTLSTLSNEDMRRVTFPPQNGEIWWPCANFTAPMQISLLISLQRDAQGGCAR